MSITRENMDFIIGAINNIEHERITICESIRKRVSSIISLNDNSYRELGFDKREETSQVIREGFENTNFDEIKPLIFRKDIGHDKYLYAMVKPIDQPPYQHIVEYLLTSS